MQLRPYQVEVMGRLRAEWRAGVRRLMLQMPTGGGKTLVGCRTAQEALAMGQRVLYVVPTGEILDQTAAKLRDAGTRFATLQAGDRPDRLPRCLLASSHTLARRVQEPVEPPWLDYTPGLVMLDEAHRLHAQHARLLRRWPLARVLGLSATPVRLDGLPVVGGRTALADLLVQGPQIQELAASGYLVPVRLLAGYSPSLRGVRVQAGDWSAAGLDRRYRRDVPVAQVVGHWQATARGRRTLCFAPGVESSRALVAEWCRRGVRALHLDASTPPDERAAALAALRTGRLHVVSNVGLFTEGLDVVEVECVVLAFATLSVARYLQSVGRGVRTSPRTGKRNLLVLDHGGNARRHGHPEDPRGWTPTRLRAGSGT